MYSNRTTRTVVGRTDGAGGASHVTHEAVSRNNSDQPRGATNSVLRLRRPSGTGMEDILWCSEDCMQGGVFSGYQNQFNFDSFDSSTDGEPRQACRAASRLFDEVDHSSQQILAHRSMHTSTCQHTFA
jgi:hypothetical protein